MTNGAVIEAEIAWFVECLDLRFRIHGGETTGEVLDLCPPPALPAAPPSYAAGILDAALTDAERLILILAMLPHLRPHALDPLMTTNQSLGRRFTEFGGIDHATQNGFRPTRETALFLLAGEAMDARLDALALFAPDATLQARRILEDPDEASEAGPLSPLTVSERWVGRLIMGAATAPRFGPAFPAQRLETPYDWDDLILGEAVREELDDLVGWVTHERTLMEDWGLKKHLKPGYRVLFHGPPGTGKTMTAAVLGKRLNLSVYRIDLSRVVSKWIGETEKNLAALFDEAAEGGVILFFDEADALFGKRGDTRSANDRHANQQISYLLQRIEDSPGVMILASNLKGNIDAAFARRFQGMVYFGMPDVPTRIQLWRAAFAGIPEGRRGDIDLASLAKHHDLPGGTIINVVRNASLRACIDSLPLTTAHVIRAIDRERLKES